MTMFADARNDDFYNQDFLNDKDTEYLAGYDACMEDIKNFILYNLDIYETELSETNDGNEVEDEVFASRKDLFEILQENTELLAAVIEDYFESERDELVTSLIENMNEDEYKANRKKVLAENKGKKEYYDTRKFAITGKKVFSEE